MGRKNERVELEDEVTTKRITTLIAELEQKLREIDEYR